MKRKLGGYSTHLQTSVSWWQSRIWRGLGLAPHGNLKGLAGVGGRHRFPRSWVLEAVSLSAVCSSQLLLPGLRKSELHG